RSVAGRRPAARPRRRAGRRGRPRSGDNRRMTTPPGLRERKKRKTRWAIQEHALRLFAQQGYDATTVEQIAAAADVSPSTFFRYFPTKEDVVIEDEYDALIVAAMAAAPADLKPLPAIRHGMRTVYA